VPTGSKQLDTSKDSPEAGQGAAASGAPGAKPVKRWTRQPEQRPDAILDSALALFRQRGVASTRIEDIAKGAGLSKGAIYLYFNSKEAMLQALVRRAVLPLAERISELSENAAQADVLPTLELIVELAGENLLEPEIAAIPLLVVAEAGQFPELARYYRTTILDRVIEAFGGLLLQGQRQGLFRNDLVPEYAVRTLMGGIFLQMIWGHVFAPGQVDKKALKRQLQQHLAIFLRGISQ
jgi:AcrR family transcriptional regulator